MDCETGDILAMASMPSFDPNSFSDGIGRLEWKMLADDDHVPLRNKILKGLYPPGSTVKPMVAILATHGRDNLVGLNESSGRGDSVGQKIDRLGIE